MYKNKCMLLPVCKSKDKINYDDGSTPFETERFRFMDYRKYHLKCVKDKCLLLPTCRAKKVIDCDYIRDYIKAAFTDGMIDDIEFVKRFFMLDMIFPKLNYCMFNIINSKPPVRNKIPLRSHYNYCKIRANIQEINLVEPEGIIKIKYDMKQPFSRDSYVSFTRIVNALYSKNRRISTKNKRRLQKKE